MPFFGKSPKKPITNQAALFLDMDGCVFNTQNYILPRAGKLLHTFRTEFPQGLRDKIQALQENAKELQEKIDTEPDKKNKKALQAEKTKLGIKEKELESELQTLEKFLQENPDEDKAHQAFKKLYSGKAQLEKQKLSQILNTLRQSPRRFSPTEEKELLKQGNPKLIAHVKNLVEEMREHNPESKLYIDLYVASNRQNPFNDLMDTANNMTISAYAAIGYLQEILQEEMNDLEIEFIAHLSSNSDVFHDKKLGTTFASLPEPKPLAETKKSRAEIEICTDDSGKLVTLYRLVHEAANAAQAQKIAFSKEKPLRVEFTDDREDLLEYAYEFYKKFPALLPAGVELKIVQYKGFYSGYEKTVSGKGPVDELFTENAKNLAFLMGGNVEAKLPIPTFGSRGLSAKETVTELQVPVAQFVQYFPKKTEEMKKSLNTLISELENFNACLEDCEKVLESKINKRTKEDNKHKAAKAVLGEVKEDTDISTKCYTEINSIKETKARIAEDLGQLKVIKNSSESDTADNYKFIAKVARGTTVMKENIGKNIERQEDKVGPNFFSNIKRWISDKWKLLRGHAVSLKELTAVKQSSKKKEASNVLSTYGIFGDMRENVFAKEKKKAATSQRPYVQQPPRMSAKA